MMTDNSKSPIKDNNIPVSVTCALIEKNGQVLVTQRGPRMKMPFKWEFPGGKVKDGETLEDCLRREIIEELGITLQIKKALPPEDYKYPELYIRLYPFICSIKEGDITLLEHHAVKWTDHEELLSLDWAEADIAVVKSYLNHPHS